MELYLAEFLSSRKTNFSSAKFIIFLKTMQHLLCHYSNELYETFCRPSVKKFFQSYFMCIEVTSMHPYVIRAASNSVLPTMASFLVKQEELYRYIIVAKLYLLVEFLHKLKSILQLITETRRYSSCRPFPTGGRNNNNNHNDDDNNNNYNHNSQTNS